MYVLGPRTSSFAALLQRHPWISGLVLGAVVGAITLVTGTATEAAGSFLGFFLCVPLCMFLVGVYAPEADERGARETPRIPLAYVVIGLGVLALPLALAGVLTEPAAAVWFLLSLVVGVRGIVCSARA